MSAPQAEVLVSSRTFDGTITGAPAYMSPEQARGEVETLDARSDIYSLGAILFEILHLRPTVTGRSAMEIVSKVGRGEIDLDGGSGAPRPMARPVAPEARDSSHRTRSARSTVPDSLVAVPPPGSAANSTSSKTPRPMSRASNGAPRSPPICAASSTARIAPAPNAASRNSFPPPPPRSSPPGSKPPGPRG